MSWRESTKLKTSLMVWSLTDRGLYFHQGIITTETAEAFLSSLNESHSSVGFTMELGEHGKLPFLGTDVRKCNGCLETRVCREPTDPGLLLHHKSHVDVRYKKSLLKKCWIVP